MGALIGLGLAAILGCEATGTEPVMDPVTATPRPVERPFHCKQKTLHLNVTSVTGRMNALDAEVVGLTSGGVREYDQRMMWLPLAFVQELAETEAVSSYMILLKQPEEAVRLRQELASAAQSKGLKVEVVDWKDTETAELLRRGMELLSVYRSLVVLVILIIAGASVLTTMMKTVRERTREVGTLRSLGYRTRHMLSMFGVESVILALHAGVAGLALAAGITAAINAWGITYKAGLMAESILLRVGYSPEAYVWGLVFLALVAFLAAMVAARKVATMTIAAALAES
jgi:putative ABC transport system permease protein